jgi:hypothetical protein
MSTWIWVALFAVIAVEAVVFVAGATRSTGDEQPPHARPAGSLLETLMQGAMSAVLWGPPLVFICVRGIADAAFEVALFWSLAAAAIAGAITLVTAAVKVRLRGQTS